MQLSCASPAQYFEADKLESITMDTHSTGRIGILKDHVALITRLKDSSKVVISSKGEKKTIQLSGASFFAIEKNQAKISTLEFAVEA